MGSNSIFNRVRNKSIVSDPIYWTPFIDDPSSITILIWASKKPQKHIK